MPTNERAAATRQRRSRVHQEQTALLVLPCGWVAQSAAAAAEAAAAAAAAALRTPQAAGSTWRQRPRDLGGPDRKFTVLYRLLVRFRFCGNQHGTTPLRPPCGHFITARWLKVGHDEGCSTARRPPHEQEAASRCLSARRCRPLLCISCSEISACISTRTFCLRALCLPMRCSGLTLAEPHGADLCSHWSTPHTAALA